MLIRVVEKSGDQPPEHEADGRLVWSGGYRASPAEEGGLPAASLIDVYPTLAVGTWYSYDNFARIALSPDIPLSEVWTTLDLSESGPEETYITRIEAPAGRAARIMLTAVAEHLARLKPLHRFWVRVE